MKTIYTKKVLLFILICAQFIVFGQYNGGNADGFSSQNVQNNTCDLPMQFYAYFGGISHLSSSSSVNNTTCSLPINYYAYFGGISDGFSSQTIDALSCALPPHFFAYFGGNGSGHAFQNIDAILCNLPPHFFAYFGGISDGFSKGETAPICPTEPPVPSFIADVTEICVGQSVTFTDTSTNLPSVWNWTFEGGTPATSDIQNPTVVYNTPGTYDVTLFVANYNGNNTNVQTDMITVTANPTITSTTPASRCGTGTLTLGATASNGTLSWFANPTGGVALGTGTSFTTPSIAVTTTYYVEASAGGCTSARTAVIATVNAVPTITSTTPASRCGTGTVTLGATASNGTLSWFANPTGGVALGTGTSFTTPSIAVTTTYYVEASAGGCTSARTAVIATVENNPGAMGNSQQTFCEGETIDLIQVTGTNIQWYSTLTGGTPLPGNTLIIAGTTYYASQTIDGCESSDRLAVTMTLGECLGVEFLDRFKLEFYPNPVINEVNIISSIEMSKIEVINLLGQTIMSKKVNAKEVILDLSFLSTGSYLIKVNSDEKQSILKVNKR